MNQKNKFVRKWIGKPTPKAYGRKHRQDGWLHDVNKCFASDDGLYAVMVRPFESERFGKVTHYAIRNWNSTDIGWMEKQKIKNELAGSEKTAIEVFPAQSELVDGANMYHLWVFEENPLDFGLRD